MEDRGLPEGTLPVHEEPWNAAIHAVGCALSVVALVALVLRPRTWPGSLAGASFGGCLVLVYGFSTLSHAVRRQPLRSVLQNWDRGAIYWLIAGTYTPTLWVFLASPYRELSLALLWACAWAGVYTRLVSSPHQVIKSTTSYLLLGWVPALALIGNASRECFVWMALGGVAYTTGTWFLVRDRQRPYFHAIWHLFVVLGSVCHFVTIYGYVLPLA